MQLSSKPPMIEIKQVSKWYGDFQVLDDCSTTVGPVSYTHLDVYKRQLDDNALPPAMPDWSPTRLFGGYAAWGDPDGAGRNSLGYRNMAACGCASSLSLIHI